MKVWKPKCSCSVTYYNFVSDQFTGLNAIVVPGTLRDSLVLLAVNLEQPTELNPIEIMTDTGAYTDIVFGLFCLLGYRFSPRIADIGGARYWRIDPAAHYGCLNGIARHRINTKLIAEHWDDLLRLAGEYPRSSACADQCGGGPSGAPRCRYSEEEILPLRCFVGLRQYSACGTISLGGDSPAALSNYRRCYRAKFFPAHMMKIRDALFRVGYGAPLERRSANQLLPSSRVSVSR